MDTVPVLEEAEELGTRRRVYPMPPPDQRERLEELWREIDEDETQLKPWPENDPIVEKYRRKGLIE